MSLLEYKMRFLTVYSLDDGSSKSLFKAESYDFCQ